MRPVFPVHRSLRTPLAALLVAAVCSLPGVASAGPGAPLPGTPRWSHAPYEDGNCELCHERADPKNPGKVSGAVNEICFSCHDEFAALMSERAHKHSPARKACTNCHNAHNSTERKGLLTQLPDLCFNCHEITKDDITAAKVDHAPVTQGAKCVSCHNPHASNVQALLLAQPFDLCVNCHSKDDMKDSNGKPLTNIKRLLAENPKHHQPVANKDCSACHVPHGGENFRLLLEAYPAAFYSPYQPENYALCFECHKSEMIQDAETTTLTRFRDGSRNLHYLHVNNPERGRTCRACHEVHAARQPHIIRDAVPYGTRGWMLKVNYTPSENGGSCAKTCHGEKSYDIRVQPKPGVTTAPAQKAPPAKGAPAKPAPPAPAPKKR